MADYALSEAGEILPIDTELGSCLLEAVVADDEDIGRFMRRLIEDHGPIRVRDCLDTAYRGMWLVFQQGVSDASDGAPLLAGMRLPHPDGRLWTGADDPLSARPAPGRSARRSAIA